MTHTRGLKHSFAFSFTCLAFLFLVVGWPGSAQAQPTMTLTNDLGAPMAGSMTIGDTLNVALSNAAPWQVYRIELMDPAGTIIAQTAGRTNNVGELHLLDLFIDSGVTPCLPPGHDTTPPEAPDGYTFGNLEEANLALAGLEITVIAINTLTETWEMTESLTFSTGSEPYVYFSDRAACLRRQYNLEEDVYISIVNGLPGVEYRVFVIDKPATRFHWKVGYPLQDVRYSELCTDPNAETCPSQPDGSLIHGPQQAQATSTHQIGGTFADASHLIAVVRRASDDTRKERLQCDQATTRSMRYYHSNVGIEGTSPSSSWTCPPCPPNSN